MKLFMTGSSGTGKTSQALLMSDIFRLNIVDGISRSSPHLMGSDEHQQYVSRRVFKKCMTMENVIQCRTPVDVFSYTVANDAYSPADKQHIELFAASNPTIIYFPMLDKIEDDGYRPTDRGFNERVDSCIKQTLSDYNIKYLELSLGSVNDRAEEIINYLEAQHGCTKNLLKYRERLSHLQH